MKIVLIGAGNVATHLGQALAKAGHQICQVYSRTEESATELAQKINAIAVGKSVEDAQNVTSAKSVMNANSVTSAQDRKDAKSMEDTQNMENAQNVKDVNVGSCIAITQLEAITSEATLYLVMLKDSVLNEILPTLVKRNPNGLFVHTAGSVPMSIWEGLTNRYGVLYPMQTFSKARPVDFDQVHFFVESNHPEDTTLLKSLAGQISSCVFEATSEQRKYLHLSAVFACNFSNHMYAICEKLLTEHGLPFSSMFPLIDETARKVHHLSPKEAQTGPAQRNDTNVMQRQETLLQRFTDDPELATLYRHISQHIVKYQEELNSDQK